MERPFDIVKGARAALAAAAILIAASAAAVHAQAPLTILGLTIPAQVAGLPHSQPYDYDKTNPGLGYSVEFLRPGWRIDVYIYDLRMTSIPDDPMSEVMKNQLAQAKADVFALEKRGNYADVVVKSDYTINDGTGRTKFVCSSFTYFHKQQGVSVDSYLCLTSWQNKFFKVRMTTGQNAASSADARRFVEAWIKVLWPS